MTCFRCGGIFHDHFIANLPRNAAVKNLKNRSITSEDMDKSLRRYFLTHSVDATAIITSSWADHQWSSVQVTPLKSANQRQYTSTSFIADKSVVMSADSVYKNQTLATFKGFQDRPPKDRAKKSETAVSLYRHTNCILDARQKSNNVQKQLLIRK